MKFYKLIFTLAILLSVLPARSALTGQWVQYPTFDNSVLNVIDTPTRTYFSGYSQSYDPVITVKSTTDQSLFYYDKEGDEIIAALKAAPLSGVAVNKLQYNFRKNYLVIVYDNYDIDLLFDNGKVVNIPALRYADIPGSKNINNITFDFAHNGIWIATDFGYLVINDDKFEVEDSRNYGVALRSAVRLADNVYVATDQQFAYAPASERRSSLSDYTPVDEYQGATWMQTISNDTMIFDIPGSAQYVNDIKYVKAIAEGLELIDTHNFNGPMIISPAKNGIILYIWGTAAYYEAGKNFVQAKKRPTDGTHYYPIGSWDYNEFFIGGPRLGLRSEKIADGGFEVTRDWMLPNAPNAYWSRGMAYHPKHGMLVNSHGVERIFSGDNINALREPILLSALQNGLWTPMAPAYTYPEQTYTGYGPLGLAVDPSDNKYVWSGSNFSGMTRLNLENPKDILHYSVTSDASASLPGFVETSPVMGWSRLCHFSPPAFDFNNTLWSFFLNYDDGGNLEFRYLTEADRKASVDAASARPWRKLIVRDVQSDMHSVFAPLTASVNKGLLLYMTQSDIVVYDTNQTPDNTSDDKRAVVSATFFDQDGGEISNYGVNCIYEDPATGNVWFGTGSGVYYLQPQSILKGQRTINRIKIARNDGTSLADYLLNGVGVNAIVSDPQGRKWFGTVGAGIVVTTSDGREVLGELTTANSDLTSDNIFKLCYNPQSRSMMISTDKGLCEFFINGSAENAGEEDGVRAYPNPVHPDYYGWVTIDGLPDGSYVKIVDSAGNLVRELGRAEAGSIQWDVLNLDNKRVKTGVYYILSSPSSGSGDSNVAKILVMN